MPRMPLADMDSTMTSASASWSTPSTPASSSRGRSQEVIAAAVPVLFVVAVVTFILPAGLGSRDITIAAVLATVLSAGVAVSTAAEFRFLQLEVELAWAAGAVAAARRSDAHPRWPAALPASSSLHACRPTARGSRR
jgi:hypothetical protein